MARAKTHKDVEYEVSPANSFDTMHFKTFDEAATHAVFQGMTTGRTMHIDTLVWSRAGAKWLMGESGVEQYDEDPDASVFERIEVKADMQGRIP